MKNIKLLLLLFIFTMVMVACKSENESTSGKQETISQKEENIVEDSAAIKEVAKEDIEQSNTILEESKTILPKLEATLDIEDPQYVDYGRYIPVIEAYEKAVNNIDGHIEGNHGICYANLKDLTGDGRYELIIARIFEDEMTDDNKVKWVGDSREPNIIIFTIDHNYEGVIYLGESQLTYYVEEERLAVEYLEDENGVCIVDGYYNNEEEIVSKELWGWYEDNTGEYQLDGYFDYMGSYYYSKADEEQGIHVSEGCIHAESYEETVNLTKEGTTTHVILAANSETDCNAITENTKKFLDNFTAEDYCGDSASFNDGSFVIIEDDQRYYEEMFVLVYHERLLFDDYESLSTLVADQSRVEQEKSDKENGMYFPGIIIKDLRCILPERYAAESLMLYRNLEMDSNLENLVEYYPFVIKCDYVNVPIPEISDPTLIPRVVPGKATSWYIMSAEEGMENDFENIRVYSIYEDNPLIASE